MKLFAHIYIYTYMLAIPGQTYMSAIPAQTYMSAIPGQTAGLIWLTFFLGTHGYPGGRLYKFQFFFSFSSKLDFLNSLLFVRGKMNCS